MPLSIESLIALVGKPVRGIHCSLGEVSGELQKINAYTLLGAIADPRFKDSPVLTRGLAWVDINTIYPKETIGGAGFVLHHSPEPEETQVQRRAELEPISDQATGNDSLIEEIISLVGKPVRGIHYSLGEVSGELQKIDAHTLLGAIADARFKDSPALTRGLVWVDINTICPKETIGGAGFVLHHSPEPEERQVQRRAELEPISNQATDNDSLIEEIAEGRKTIQFAYVPTAIDSSRPFIDPASQSMLGILLEDMKQDLVSLKMPPVAVACIPELYQELGKKYPGGIENVESIGLKIYQRDDLSMPGEEPYKAAFRLFFDEEELWLFLNSDRQSISQPHFSRSMMEQSSTEYSQDVAHKTDDFLKSFTDKLSDL